MEMGEVYILPDLCLVNLPQVKSTDVLEFCAGGKVPVVPQPMKLVHSSHQGAMTLSCHPQASYESFPISRVAPRHGGPAADAGRHCARLLLDVGCQSSS